MIVVAIIGVLASIAIPQYQNYTARAQASEALSITAGLRADIAEQFSLNGTMPTAEADLGIANDQGKIEAMSGRYVASVDYANSNISVTFKEDTAIGSETMTIAAVDSDPTQGWICSGLENKLLPSGCKEAAAKKK